MKVSIIIVSYNHEKYIQECLESIRYQVDTYNKVREHYVQVLVADDCSQDKTEEKVKSWMSRNKECFDEFVYVKSASNVGTCRNYMNALEKSDGDYIKAIGGDDFFASNSIFEMMSYLDEYDIVYGLPLIYIEDGNNKLEQIKKEVMRTHYINLEESKLSFYDRIHRYCFFNAPGTYARKELMINPAVLKMLSEYKYIDDYTQWLKFSEIKDIKLKYLPDITVIYRRTKGSTYIVRNQELRKEMVKVFQYALDMSHESIGKWIQRSAIYMQKKDHTSKYFDILSYIHAFYRLKHRTENMLYIDNEIKQNLKYIENIKEKVKNKNEYPMD